MIIVLVDRVKLQIIFFCFSPIFMQPSKVHKERHAAVGRSIFQLPLFRDVCANHHQSRLLSFTDVLMIVLLTFLLSIPLRIGVLSLRQWGHVLATVKALRPTKGQE